MGPMIWQCNHLTKSYQSTTALASVNLSIQEREFLTITGPSGSGKTTLLMIIAGLLEPDGGTIQKKPGVKPILVFQDFQLFPGMTVEGNLEFGLKAQRIPKDQRLPAINRLLQDFDLMNQRAQYPSQLSAGQQQRTALARALAVNPQLLLLDEPFAHLDRELKHSTALYLRHLHDTYNVTTIMVTHDQEEALAVSTRIIHLSGGRILQSGTPQEMLYSPQTLETARFFGELNELTDPESGKIFYGRPQDLRLLYPSQTNPTNSNDTSQTQGIITKKMVHPLGFRYNLQVQGKDLTVLSPISHGQIGETWALEVERTVTLTDSNKPDQYGNKEPKEAIA